MGPRATGDTHVAGSRPCQRLTAAVAAARAPSHGHRRGIIRPPRKEVGEVQTPLTGHPAALLRVGDLVCLGHAKSGEPSKHTHTVRLPAGDTFVDEVPTYRGCGNAW